MEYGSRNFGIDVIKVFAAAAVIMNHALLPPFHAQGYSTTWLITTVVLTLSRIAVPLFLMSSGFLMFRRQPIYFKNVKKTIKIFLIMSFISFFYQIILKDGANINFNNLLLSIYSSASPQSFWYIFLYIGLLLIAPILYKALNALSKKDLIYLIASSLIVFSILPIILGRLNLPDLSEHFSNLFITPMLLYVVIGYYIYRFEEEVISFRKINFKLIILFMFSWILFIFLLKHDKISGDYDMTFWDNRKFLHVIIMSSSVFTLAINIFKDKQNRIITYLSSLTFTIYLIADSVLLIGLNTFYKSIYKTVDNHFINRFIFGIVVFLISVGISFFIKYINNKYRDLKK